MRLFCFPWAGGFSVIYNFWKNTDFPTVIAMDYPGHGKRFQQKLVTDFKQMVKDAVEQVLRQSNGEPLCLFGHSMGALIAFETSHMLQNRGVEIKWLFVSGMCAPKSWEVHDVENKADVFNKVQQLQGTPKEVLDNPHLLELFMPIIQSDYLALNQYKYEYRQLLQCPITVYSGIGDVNMYRCRDGWKEETALSCTFMDYPGEHFYIKEYHREIMWDIKNAIQSLKEKDESRGFIMDGLLLDNSMSSSESKGRKLAEVRLMGRTNNDYTPSERYFAVIWAEVLEADEIDIYANFNDIGGNSILASRLIKSLEKEFPDVFDITDVFTYSTVFKISEYYDERTENNADRHSEKSTGESKQNNIEDVLAKLALGEISIEEASKFI